MNVPYGGRGSGDEAAARLRAARRRAGLGLAAAARQLGYSVSHLSNVERGVKVATPHLVQAYEGLGSGSNRLSDGPVLDVGTVETVVEPPPFRLREPAFESCDDRFGTRLMRLRLAKGWSLRQAALIMKISHTHLANLESGSRTPSAQTAKICDDFLAKDGSLSALADRERTKGNARSTSLDPRYRAEVRLNADAPLSAWQLEFERLRSAAQMSRPVLVYPAIAGHADALAQLAANRGGAWWILAARFAELAGWMAQEAALPQVCAQWTEAAARWAMRGGNRDMAAYAWERLSLDPFCRGDARTAILLAQRGANAHGASPRVRGLAMCRVAQGHAMLPGERDACLRALDSAARLLAAEPDAAPTAERWGTGSMPAIPTFVEAWCLIELGRYEQAAELLGPWHRTAVDPHALRTRARYAVRTAMALAGAGEDQQAALVIGELLPAAATIDSASIRADVRNLIKLIVRRRNPLLVRLVPDLRNIASP